MIRISRRGPLPIFDLEELRELLPVVIRITRGSVNEAKKAARVYGNFGEVEPERVFLKARLNRIIWAWAEKMRKLGADPKEPWTVHFQGSKQWFCWRWGSTRMRSLAKKGLK